MKAMPASPNACIKCKGGTLMTHKDEMDKANGLLPERKCNQCGKEYPSYPFRYKLQGLHGKRPVEVDLFLNSLVREMMPIQKEQTVNAICTVLGVNDKLIYGFYTAIRKEMGISGVTGIRSMIDWTPREVGPSPVQAPRPVPVQQPEPSVLSWTKTEKIVQPWKVTGMNGIMPEFEEELVIEWTGRIVSREVREKHDTAS